MRFFVRSLPVIATCALLAACQNGGQKSSGSPYVSNYGNDGGYNPYPDQPGTMQSGGGGGGGGGGYSPAPAAPATPTYSTPPVQSDPYAFSPGSSGSSSSGSSSSTTSSAPKKTPAKTTASSSKGKAKSKSTAKKSSGSYKVAGGDTLYGIALKRGTTVAKIKAANKLTSDLIRPGQALKIP